MKGNNYSSMNWYWGVNKSANCSGIVRSRSRLLLLLLFRHSAKSSNAQDEHLSSSPWLLTRIHLPHAVAVRLHVRKNNVAILTPETAVAVGVWAVAYPCRLDFPFRMKPWVLPDDCCKAQMDNDGNGNAAHQKATCCDYHDLLLTVDNRLRRKDPCGGENGRTYSSTPSECHLKRLSVYSSSPRTSIWPTLWEPNHTWAPVENGQSHFVGNYNKAYF